MLERAMLIIVALSLFAVCCACAPPPDRVDADLARVEAAKQWTADMRYTPLSIVCVEVYLPDLSRVQCDVRTLEHGAIPLNCGHPRDHKPACRLGSV